MSLGEEYGNRFIGNIEGVFVAVIAGAFSMIGESLAEVAEPTGSITADGSISTLLLVIQNYPLIIALAGLAIVTISAGPIGILGFVFEAAGTNVFLSAPVAGMVLFAIGAGIIVVGARIWSWVSFIDWFISNRRGGSGIHSRR
ncbi:hypothetical protein [Natrinema pallidum]|uniref:Uncharacterized protein n=1 Tax=Natrinema pallidum TaxID=69527 RepID=A0A4P9TBA1_9EURY|nr:hypothetical protein [Natrinema pallidum]QCW01891.1 hypothetical protein FGF80_00935 [Natrinema pallidum]